MSNPNEAIFSSLEAAPPEAIRLLARGLTLAGPPLREFGQAFAYLATSREHAEPPSDLARLALRRAVRVTASHPRCPELLDDLERVTEPPWPQIREALVRLIGGPACDQPEAKTATREDKDDGEQAKARRRAD